MPRTPVRLAEVLGGLSLASDLLNGFAHGKVVRTAILATRLAQEMGADVGVQRDAYYASLLRYLGCSGFAHEEAAEYGAGDDIALRNAMALADPDEPWSTLSAIVARVGAGAGVGRRGAAVARLLGDGVAVTRHARSQCDASVALARIVGASDELLGHLRFTCERWDGKGAPLGVAGEATPMAMRLHTLADAAEIAFHRHGRSAAVELVRRRAGKQLDPRAAAAFVAHSGALLDAIDETGTWERFLELEPAPVTVASLARVDAVARALGTFADLKSVFTLGHSAAVAELAEAIAQRLDVPPRCARIYAVPLCCTTSDA